MAVGAGPSAGEQGRNVEAGLIGIGGRDMMRADSDEGARDAQTEGSGRGHDADRHRSRRGRTLTRAGPALALLLVAGVPAMAQEEPVPATTAEAPAGPAADAVTTQTRIESDSTTTMEHSAIVAAAPAEVWTAISTPDGWARWAAPLARWAEGESDILETSYDPAELPGGPGTIWQQFVARIPGRLLVFRTIKAPDDFPHWDEYRKVTSFIELAPEGAGTRLRLTSTGYPDTEGGRALLSFFARGNAATIESLQRIFTDAAAAPESPEEGEAPAG